MLGVIWLLFTTLASWLSVRAWFIHRVPRGFLTRGRHKSLVCSRRDKSPRACGAKADPDTKELMDTIRTATSPGEVLEVVLARGSDFDEIHTATAMYTIANMVNGEFGQTQGFSELLKLLEVQIARMDSYALANSAWSIARISTFESIVPNAATLVHAVSQAAERVISTFKPVDVQNLVWSIAIVNVSNPQLMDAIAGHTIRSIGDMQPKHLAKVAWSFARLQIVNTPLMNEIAKAIVRRPPSGGMKHIDWGEIVLSFAKLGIRSDALMAACFEAFSKQRALSQCDAWTIAALLWVCDSEEYRQQFVAFGRSLVQEAKQRGLNKQDIQSPLLLDHVAWKRARNKT